MKGAAGSTCSGTLGLLPFARCIIPNNIVGVCLVDQNRTSNPFVHRGNAAILIYIVWSPLKKIELICWPCTDFLCGFSVAHECVFLVCRACLPPAEGGQNCRSKGKKTLKMYALQNAIATGCRFFSEIFSERGSKTDAFLSSKLPHLHTITWKGKRKSDRDV